MEIAYGSTSTNYTLYVDPNITLPQTSWTSALTKTGAAGFPSFDAVKMVLTASSSSGDTWDELRIGTSSGAVVPLSLPAIPTGLTATGGTNVTLSWTESPTTNVAGYDIQSSTDDVNWSALATVTGATTTSYTYRSFSQHKALTTIESVY